MELISPASDLFTTADFDPVDNVMGYGLYNGKAGLGMVYFILFRYTGKQIFEDKAKRLLDDISENITSVEQLNYAEGLSGIGWAIEWIVQNKFIKANTDDVLEDIDDTVYKSVLYAPDKAVSLTSGTLSKAAYFLKRFQSINLGTHRFKTICHQECLVLLTDEIKERTAVLRGLVNIDKLYGHDHQIADQMIDLAHSLIFLSKFLPYKMNVQAVEDSLYDNIKHVEALLSGCINFKPLASPGPDIQYAILLIVYAYFDAGIKLKCQHWKKQGLDYFDRIMSAECFYSNLLRTRKESLPIIGRLLFHTGKECYRDIVTKTFEREDLKSARISSLAGSADLLTAISCSYPSLIGWDEALLYS